MEPVAVSVYWYYQYFWDKLQTKIKYRSLKEEQGITQYYAKTKKAKDLLKWESDKDLFDMCADSLRWQQNYIKI